MENFIFAVLVLIVLYCFSMWGFLAYRAFTYTKSMRAQNIEPDEYALDKTELYTFHLGLCGTLAAGFLGIAIVLGG